MKNTKQKKFYYLLLLPTTAFFIIIILFPMIYGIYISLQDISLVDPQLDEFVGLGNYIRIFSSFSMWRSFGRTIYFVIISVGLSFIIGFITSLVLAKEKILGKNFFRSVFLIPMIISPMVIGATFRYILNYDYGIINYFFQILGLPRIPFLGASSWSLNAIILVDVWQWTPFMILVLLAGLETLPKEPYEAAKIDGASFLQEIRHITLPLLKPVISVAILVRTMDAFREFTKVYIMTSGGPGTSSEILSYYLWRIGFQYFRIGEATAGGIFLMHIIILACFLYIISMGKNLLRGENK